MPQSGFTPIQHYRSSTPAAVADAADLVDGELFVNISDGTMFFKNASGVVTLLADAGLSIAASGGSTGLSFSGGPLGPSGGTLTLAGTLAVAHGGTGAANQTDARTNLGAAASGLVTASGLTMNTARLLGRSTAAAGAVEEISIGGGLSLSGGVLSGEGAWVQIGPDVPTTSGSAVTFASIPGTYSDLMLEFVGVSPSGAANIEMDLSDNGTNYTGPAFLTVNSDAADVVYGQVLLSRYLGGIISPLGQLASVVSSRGVSAGNTNVNSVYRLPGALTHIRISLSSGTFDAGLVRLFGR